MWWVSRPTTPYFMRTGSFTLWDFDFVSLCSTKAEASLGHHLTYDSLAGTFRGSNAASAEIEVTMDAFKVEVVGNSRMQLAGDLSVALAESGPPRVTRGWTISLSGIRGVRVPFVLLVCLVCPEADAVISPLLDFPVVGDFVGAWKGSQYLITGGQLSGKYEPGETGNCFLGTTSMSSKCILGLLSVVGYDVDILGLQAYAQYYTCLMGSPEFQICPDFQFEGVTVSGTVGLRAGFWLWEADLHKTLSLRWGPGGQLKVLAIASIPESDTSGCWQPIGDSYLRWGPTNLLAAERGSGGRLHALSAQAEASEETRLVENVVPLASPAIISGPSGKLILFCLHDPNKPWYAATDIGTVRQADDQAWVLDRIADDQAAEFGPSAVSLDSGVTLAAWERVSGDISDTNEPGQVVPHLEVVAARWNPTTGVWSTPQQLTSNTVGDRDVLPIVMGAVQGILWIQNEGDAAIGDANSGDRLMFAKWSGNNWDEPQTLWSAQKSVLDFSFVADGLAEGHVVLAVDEDKDPNTTADRELYLLSTANGAWQTVMQLTSDFNEDTFPTLVAPDGVPMCLWNADGTLVYTQLEDWNPRPVYSEYTLANEAPSLDGVTMPSGAAIAYTVQGPNGVDIVASFYDADLDCWSLPRQLTQDEHGETSLSLTCEADELVIAYLKTQTERTDMDVEIDGQMVHLENIPQPGRTDLYVLRHALANDLAVVAESLVVDPANPKPGTAATILATIENRGDLPLQDVEVVFYDGDPSKGGVAIGNKQVISGTLIAGGKQDVSVSWSVPSEAKSHRIFAVADPCLAVEDRDRSNNALSVHTVLPDLAVETCWSTEVSPTSMALTARVVNAGVVPADAFEVSWRLGAADGEQIGTSTIETLIPGGAHEAAFTWDTTGHLDAGQSAQVFAVVDSAGIVLESDETNNVSSLAVFHPPAVPPGTP
jgi:hypothetical protein